MERKFKKFDDVVLVGDKIEVRLLSKLLRFDVVTRVTKTMAICEKPGQKDIRYPRIVSMFFGPFPYRSSQISYRVIDQESK